MARLLVSVRDAFEARDALAGGADIIDVKEPSRGSLGMAPWPVWQDVRRVVPLATPVSVALGELREWLDPGRGDVPATGWGGIAFRKVGLAGARPSWREDWRRLRERGDGPRWVAVVYLDGTSARAPEPEAVIDEAAAVAECAGVLFDTWDKQRPQSGDPPWERWIARVRASGRFVAVAGSLDEPAIRRLRPLGPDIFAVRGAACRDGRRDGPVESARLAWLVAAAHGAERDHAPMSNLTPCASGRSRP